MQPLILKEYDSGKEVKYAYKNMTVYYYSAIKRNYRYE